MIQLNKIELILILCFYYIGKEKNVEGFTIKFNQYFGKDVSTQTVLFAVSKFKNVNPANNVLQRVVDKKYKELWDYYVEQERISELRALYRSFKSGEYIEQGFYSRNDEFLSRTNQYKHKLQPIIDVPKKLPGDYLEEGSLKYKRNHDVVLNALAAAEFLCEGECSSELFKRMDGITNYTEAHHLIPICYQKEFAYSLDVEANVVSLCPNCHRRLHYGADKEDLLQKLYIKRKCRLYACSIGISFEKLLLLYR